MIRRWLALLLLVAALVGCSPLAGARTIVLEVDGGAREIQTDALTVGGLLEQTDVRLDADDRVTPSEPTLLEGGMTVRVTRVETQVETQEREIPYDRRTVHDTSIPIGETQLLEAGVTGLEELIFRVTLEDGIEVERHLVRQVTLRDPRTEVILVGAQGDQTPTSITGTIAYVAHQNGWLMQRISSNKRRLTHTGDLDGRVFSLSSDGAHLLFSRVPTETEETGPLNTLWIVDTSAANADPVQLEVDGVLWAAWEPGCEVSNTGSRCRIAYTTGRVVEGNPGWRAENDLWVARPQPSTGSLIGKRQVLQPDREGSYSWWGTTYAWSPNGQNLAYASADEVGVVRVYDGRRSVLSHFAPYRTYAPWVWTPTVEWSPEGAYIITTLHGPSPTRGAPEDSPVFDVWALSSDGTITAELSSEAGMWSVPTFAPESDLIAFGRARSPYASQTSGYDVHLMDRDGSDRRLLFPSQDEIGLEYPEIAWSPPSDEFATVYQENLYLIGVTGGDVRQLTVGGGVTTLEWQPGSWDDGFGDDAYDSGAGPRGAADDTSSADTPREGASGGSSSVGRFEEDADKYGSEIGIPAGDEEMTGREAGRADEEFVEPHEWLEDDQWNPE